MGKLVILRGNSGSGKSTIAKSLQNKMGQGTMLVQQDVVRREMLKVKDDTGNPAIELIYQLVMYGATIEYDVILEGILSTKKYDTMLHKLIRNFGGTVHSFYFDISFEETLRRHAMKPNSHEFGEIEMRDWWKDKDYLGLENEQIITDTMSQTQTVDFIYEHINT